MPSIYEEAYPFPTGPGSLQPLFFRRDDESDVLSIASMDMSTDTAYKRSRTFRLIAKSAIALIICLCAYALLMSAKPSVDRIPYTDDNESE